MSERTIDAGIFTAYGYAKQGGYSGTAEEFASDLANIEGFPAPPSQDGTYVLKCTVSNGSVTYSWVSE